jgi:hypothetical protein
MFKCLNLVLLLCLAMTLSALDIGGIGDTGELIEKVVMDEIGHMYTNPQKLIKGFADALVFAGHGATQRAYGDYDRFALSVGAMGALRIEEKVFGAETFSNAADTLLNEGDYTIGVNVQSLVVQAGINVSRWYFGVRLGRSNLDLVDNLDFSTLLVGVVGHYQLIEGRGMGNGYEKMFRWRGLSLGSGLLYQKASLTYSLEFDDFTNRPVAGHTYTAREPTLDLDMTTTVFTIPVEIHTSGLLFYILNVNVGVGADISFGKNDASVSMDTDVYRNNEPDSVGSIYAKGGGEMMPTIVNPKVMFNLGVKVGPVFVDIPFAYYFIGGLQAGVTLGFCL